MSRRRPRESVAEHTARTYERSLRFVESLLATTDRDRLVGAPRGREHTRLVRPWRGRVGRRAAAAAARARTAALVTHARDLRAAGRTNAEIAAAIGRSARTVRRLLGGQL